MTSGLLARDQRRLTIASMGTIAAAGYNNLSVSAALPAIGDDLGNLDLLPWIVTIELVSSAIAVLAIGPVIDAIGTRKVFRGSVLAFVLASVACGVAPNVTFLIIARALQGLTTGALIANVMTTIGLGVPEALRPRAYAANSSVWGIMGVAGPAIAASILAVSNWPGIFFVNVPVGLAAALVGWNALPGPEEGSAKAIADRRGLLIVIAFTLLSLGTLSSLVWWTPIAVVGSVLLVALYVRHERSADPPLLRMRHITSPTFRTLHVTAFLVITAGICSNTFLPVYVKGARGASTSEAAFAVVFLTTGWTTGAFASSRISELRHGEFAMVSGAAMLVISSTTAALGTWFTWPLWLIFAAFTGVGIGLGAVSSSGLGVLQSKAAPAEMGRVNSAHQFIRTLGFTYGAALGGAILFGVVSARLGDADVVRDLLSDEPVAVNDELVLALSRGFAWSVVLAAVLASAAFGFAVRLNSQRR